MPLLPLIFLFSLALLHSQEVALLAALPQTRCSDDNIIKSSSSLSEDTQNAGAFVSASKIQRTVLIRQPLPRGFAVQHVPSPAQTYVGIAANRVKNPSLNLKDTVILNLRI
jgi:hypothetical protein